MGVSVSNILLRVGMNTRGFETGAKRISDLEKNIRQTQRNNNAKAIEESRKLNQLFAESVEASNLYDAALQQLKKATVNLAKAREKLAREKDANGDITGEYTEKVKAASAALAKQKKEVDNLAHAHEKLQRKYELAGKELVDHAKARKKNVDAMKQELAQIRQQQSSFAGIKKALAGLGIGAAIGASAHQFTKMVDTLDAMAKRARDVQMTASQLQELTHQANLAGVGAGALDISIKSFNRNISLAAMNTGEAKNAIAKMGLALKDANGESKTQAQLLRETAYYFADNAGNAENAGLAARLFGERGAEMLRIFESGRETIDAVFSANKIDAAAAAAEEFNRNMSNLSDNIMPSIYKVVGDIANVINYEINPERFFTSIAEKQFESLNLTRAQKKELIDTTAQLSKLEEKLSMLKPTKTTGFFGAMKTVDNPEYKITKEQINALREKQKELAKIGGQQFINNEKEKEAGKAREESDKRLAAQEAERLRQEQQSYEELYQLTLATAEARDKEDADAKKAADEARRLQLKRDEYDLQLRIKQLESGDSRQQAAADALKNSIERNRLMKEYGFSIEEATERLKAQRELENAGNNQAQYSDADRKKAERILKRGEKGTVGKKTLEQAQAILDGKEVEGDAVDMFKGAQRNAQRNKKKNSNKTKFATDEQMEIARNTVNKNAQPQDQQLQAQQQGNDQQNETQQKLLDNTDKTVENTQSLVDAIKDLKNTVEIMKNSMIQYYSK